jgi:hypothetical protein
MGEPSGYRVLNTPTLAGEPVRVTHLPRHKTTRLVRGGIRAVRSSD